VYCKPNGITLTGGDAGATSIGFLLGAATGSVEVAGQIIGALNLSGAILDIARGKKALGNIYYDTFLPNIAYVTQENDDGGIDLLVYNILSPFIALGFGADSAFYTDLGKDEEGQENNRRARTGILRISVRARASGGWPRGVAFDFVNASTGTLKDGGITSTLLSGFNSALLSGQGDFNMVFRDRNLLTVVSLLQNAVKGVPILQSRRAAVANDNEKSACCGATFILGSGIAA
jgi:hypothetical protein